MPERSYPFDGGEGAYITEADWSMLAQIWQDSGVVAVGPSDPALKVYSLGEPGIIYVSPGQATVLGFHYVNTTDLPLNVPANTDTTYSRIDIVVLQLDKNTNAVRAIYKTGTPSPTPVAPEVDRSFDNYEVLLARVVMGPGMTVPPDASPGLTDAREFIGKRIGHIWSGSSNAPDGAIVYRQSDGAFLARSKGQDQPIALGEIAPPGATLCTSTTRPSNPSPGLIIFETDTYRTYIWYGGKWRAVGSTAAPVADSSVKTTDYVVRAGQLTYDGTTVIGLTPPYSYIIQAEIYYRAATSNGALSAMLHADRSAIYSKYTAIYSSLDRAVTTAYDTFDVPIPLSASVAGQIYSLRVTGMIRPSSGGTFSVWFNYDSANTDFTLLTGSYLHALRI